MKQFITIVLRNQFNLFYRFGYTFVPKEHLIEFNGTVSDVENGVLELFSRLTPFEYDEEYLILHFEKETVNPDITKFNIQDLVAIYPLSQQAKVSIESKIDSRIRLEEPVFESILPKIESEIDKEEIDKAIHALWNICHFQDEDFHPYISKIGEENIMKGLDHRKKGIKAQDLKQGNYWEYLIAYDRHDYFPNTSLGCFYDAGQVFAYSQHISTFEGSKLHGFLSELNNKNPEIKMPEIIERIKNDERTKQYVEKTSQNVQQYIIAPLFLFLRNDIREHEDDVSQTHLYKKQEWLKETFGDNFKYALILLGTFFGFKTFYDVYYDSLNLRFYKTHNKPESIIKPDPPKPPEKSEETQQTEHDDSLSQNNPTDTTEASQTENEERQTETETQPVADNDVDYEALFELLSSRFSSVCKNKNLWFAVFEANIKGGKTYNDIEKLVQKDSLKDMQQKLDYTKISEQVIPKTETIFSDVKCPTENKSPKED
jgi:hypothetical protein